MSVTPTVARPVLDWDALFDRFNASGLTQRTFCEQNDVSYEAFRNRYRKSAKFQGKRRASRGAKISSTTSSSFRPVRLSGRGAQAPGAFCAPSLLVRVDERFAIECPLGADPLLVAELARAIAR